MSIEKNSIKTPIYSLDKISVKNRFYIKRDDLYPFSFGGNKARKAVLYWKELEKKKADCVVTYGSCSSNHCRVISNLAAMKGIPCIIISPIENSEETFNSDMMTLFGAEIRQVPVKYVSDTIDETLHNLRMKGKNPYFIMGGGHGNIGTQAYVDVYHEICEYEKEHGIWFDYIFHASGTGTTQAGLVCGQILSEQKQRSIVGISIARKNPYGRDVIVQSVKDYLNVCEKSSLFCEESVIFLDMYAGEGYAKGTSEINRCIEDILRKEGIALDPVYTGKAFCGMLDYLEEKEITGKNILFIHTGGTPLFFDFLDKTIRAKDGMEK